MGTKRQSRSTSRPRSSSKPTSKSKPRPQPRRFKVGVSEEDRAWANRMSKKLGVTQKELLGLLVELDRRVTFRMNQEFPGYDRENLNRAQSRRCQAIGREEIRLILRHFEKRAA
jgi:hypothetical protein